MDAGEGGNHNGGKLSATEEESMATSWTSEIHPNMYRGGASKGILNASSEYHAYWNICPLITYNSLYLGSRNTVFFLD